MRAHVFVYIIEEVAHAHAQNTPLEWFLSTPGLRVMPRSVLIANLGLDIPLPEEPGLRLPCFAWRLLGLTDRALSVAALAGISSMPCVIGLNPGITDVISLLRLVH